jgi:hypothetical protein
VCHLFSKEGLLSEPKPVSEGILIIIYRIRDIVIHRNVKMSLSAVTLKSFYEASGASGLALLWLLLAEENTTDITRSTKSFCSSFMSLDLPTNSRGYIFFLTFVFDNVGTIVKYSSDAGISTSTKNVWTRSTRKTLVSFRHGTGKGVIQFFLSKPSWGEGSVLASVLLNRGGP